MSEEVQVVRRLFVPVERRDRDGLLACYAEDVEITKQKCCPTAAPAAVTRARWNTP